MGALFDLAACAALSYGVCARVLRGGASPPPQSGCVSPLRFACVYLAAKFLRLMVTDCDLDVRSATLDPSYYQGKTVWITGASSGIGRALAHALAALDVDVKLILSGRNRDALADVARDVPAAGRRATAAVVAFDLQDLESVDAAFKEVEAICPEGIDILFNNGGLSTRALCENTVYAVDEKVMVCDYLSHMKLTKLVLPGMIAKKSGHVVNTSSLAGKVGFPMRTAYCAAKFAVVGAFDALRVEVARYGIRVTNVCPGSVQTDVDRNAATADGSRFGAKDPAIANGMPVARCARLMLTAVSSGLYETWFYGNAREKLAAYLGTYTPSLFKWYLLLQAERIVTESERLIATQR